ncbi:RNA polymerase sigma factor [Nitrosomonas sp.]|uniref:RNA polymerase sigma factor n=1 Tax=Nitrosomonas sp. TaxID=42353 RepID=UPI001DCCD063|nr:RNA polymerase sigma factor [Nitrosomonas sp.]MBX3615817.1 RNA polymerase sigma factor [Nitrosomonas sp.]
MVTRQEFSDFLAGTEKRAYKQAMFAVHDEQAALDIVQDSMMKLTAKYATRPAEELPLLFQRILQNTIRDYYRRQKIRTLWTTLFSAFTPKDQDKNQEDFDILETLLVKQDSNDPDVQFERAQLIALIEEALEILPPRQREAFILRYWEEMSLAETADIMKCSEGSVKTHCSRAVHSLATILKAKGVEL